MRRTLLGLTLCGTMLVALVALCLSAPVVQYSAATRKPVGCVVKPDANGVNWLPASSPRCKEIIAGRHEAEWVR